jgi:hypothetical protein
MIVSLALALLLAAAPEDFHEYLDQVRKRVESTWNYPDKSDNLQGTVKFNLDRAGRVSELTLTNHPAVRSSTSLFSKRLEVRRRFRH